MYAINALDIVQWALLHHFGVGRAGRDKVTQGEASLVGNFPVGRFLMSALTWVFLLLHVNLVRRQCCALTGFAWAKGAVARRARAITDERASQPAPWPPQFVMKRARCTTRFRPR